MGSHMVGESWASGFRLERFSRNRQAELPRDRLRRDEKQKQGGKRKPGLRRCSMKQTQRPFEREADPTVQTRKGLGK